MHQALPDWILHSLADGVIVIGNDGGLLAVNPAAERLLRIEADTVIGQTFANVFGLDEAMDELVQAVLDAIYGEAPSRQRLLRLERADTEPRVLALTTSLLNDDAGARLGLVALLKDITELEALRVREQRLNAELTESNQALTGAYRDLEERNAELSALTRRVALVRNLATGFVILLFLGIGVVVWNQGAAPAKRAAPDPQLAAGADSPHTLILEPRPHQVSLKLIGTLEPLAVVNLVAALDGTVAERFFDYGAAVSAGDPLFTIDPEPARVGYRDARVAYLGALEEAERLRHWDSSAEMHRARRGLTRAEASLKALERKEQETRRLLELGIVPAAELETLSEQLLSARMELTQAGEELAGTEAQGAADKVTVAELKLENARFSLQEWEDKLAKTAITAPVDGVVMVPATGKDSGSGELLEVGSQVKAGVAALALGDLTGLSVLVAVDELDIGRLQVGQPVWIIGEAFPDERLRGEVERVSAQAKPAQGRSAPTFDVRVRVPTLSASERERIRVGMSAQMDVLLEDEPAALMVPIGAILQGPDGPQVRVREDGVVREVPVTLGLTDIDSVRVLDGLTAGMEILVTP